MRTLLTPNLFLILLFAASFSVSYGDQKTVQVVGIVECADCQKHNIQNSHASKGLKVTVDCKLAKGEVKTRGVGEVDEEGKFKVDFPQELVENGKLKEECYAQLHSASNTACPAYNGIESSKIRFVSESDGKHTFSPVGTLKFSPETCTSAFLWPFFKYPPLPSLPPFPKKSFSLPNFPLPSFPPKTPCPPFFKKPLLPPLVPVYEKPLPPLVPIVKKPCPPPVPIVKPLPPPVPAVKKPCPPPAPIVKPLPPPTPIVKKPCPPPVPVYKPLPPPIPIFKKPCPPIFNKPPLPPFPYKQWPPIPKLPPFPHKQWPPIPTYPPFPHKQWPSFPKLSNWPKPPRKFHHKFFGHPKLKN